MDLAPAGLRPPPKYPAVKFPAAARPRRAILNAAPGTAAVVSDE